ncbi:hypothetical protein ACTXT7_014308 [Hymenolepis weldensis]
MLKETGQTYKSDHAETTLEDVELVRKAETTVFEIPMYISLGVSIASALTYGLTYVSLNAHVLFKNSNGDGNEEDDQYRPHAVSPLFFGGERGHRDQSSSNPRAPVEIRNYLDYQQMEHMNTQQISEGVK